MSGVTLDVVSSSDGTTGQSKGRADYGTMTIAGQTFGFGPDGFVAAGSGRRSRACRTTRGRARGARHHGQLPKPTYEADGDKASSTVEGLIVRSTPRR